MLLKNADFSLTFSAFYLFGLIVVHCALWCFDRLLNCPFYVLFKHFNLVAYLSAEHEKKQSLEETPAQHRCQIKLKSLVQQRTRCSATSITWKYLYSALTLQPGKSLQNQHSKSWATEVDEEGVSLSYVRLYIDLSLYSPLTEVISCQRAPWGISLIWLVLNQGSAGSAKAGAALS